MVQILVVGHGGYATGVKENLEMVCGIPENMHFIDFALGQERETLEENIENVLSRLKEEPVLFCVDLQGATPFQIAAIKTADNLEKYHTVSGLNAMAFMEMSMGTEGMTLQEIAGQAVKTAKEAVIQFPE